MNKPNESVDAGAPAIAHAEGGLLRSNAGLHMGKFAARISRLLMAGALTVALSGQALGSDTGLHQKTATFNVYLGVVPAKTLRDQPRLVDRHKSLHDGLARESDSQHLTASVRDIGTDKQVLDATVIAEVRHKRWAHKAIERPLEKMWIGETVTYGNFFVMSEHGDYEIRTKIYLPQGAHAEVANFTYRKPDG
ncbi:MAG: hypothetical protein HY942_09520 [Gammaproteobacteria bacterium]|nr:hypothetical protein [Gammaproteobacteria bacterium]